IALIGANGRGKSTLLRIIAGADADFEGTAESGHNVTQTFFAQHQLEALHLENEILQELQAFAPKHTETELRTILGSFLFTGDDAFKKIKVLSGGEKSRVALAKALTADANFLLLDEPTNHLDIQSINILIQALKQYKGTFVVVSHDRYLLDNVANKIWYIEDMKIKEYPGTYQEYEDWRITKENNISQKEKKKEIKTKTEKKYPESEPEENEARERQAFSLNKDLERLNQEIMAINEELKELEKTLGNPEIYQDTEKLTGINKDYENRKSERASLQERWEVIADKILELEQLES